MGKGTEGNVLQKIDEHTNSGQIRRLATDLPIDSFFNNAPDISHY
jgi:hypothetical protein